MRHAVHADPELARALGDSVGGAGLGQRRHAPDELCDGLGQRELVGGGSDLRGSYDWSRLARP